MPTADQPVDTSKPLSWSGLRVTMTSRRARTTRAGASVGPLPIDRSQAGHEQGRLRGFQRVARAPQRARLPGWQGMSATTSATEPPRASGHRDLVARPDTDHDRLRHREVTGPMGARRPRLRVMIRCPATGNEVATGFTAMSSRDFDRMRLELLMFKCRSCGDEHIWSKGKALVRLGDESDSTADEQRGFVPSGTSPPVQVSLAGEERWSLTMPCPTQLAENRSWGGEKLSRG
jgi:hypothetical protein